MQVGSFFRLGIYIFDCLLFMIVAWFFACVLLTMALVVIRRFLLNLILNYFVEGRGGVKLLFMRNVQFSA